MYSKEWVVQAPPPAPGMPTGISIVRVNEIPVLEGVRVEKMQTVETLNEGLKRAYTQTITAKDIDARVEKEVKTLAPQVRMPGFRPGKVPANLVRKMHGEALQQEDRKSVGEGKSGSDV